VLTWAAHPLADNARNRLGGGALMAWPASEAVVALMHRLIAESTRIQPLARLDFSAGIPAEHRVLVVIPSMLTSAASNAELAHRLQLHWLASRETQAQFALLTDWADAETESTPGDAELFDDALARLRALNAAYPRRTAAGALFAAAPPAQLVGHRAPLDRLGTQARQA
jgi:cyclic beta-1,2-glucan synthetase